MLVGKLRWECTKGKGFNLADGFDAEDIREAWEESVDFTDADHPTDVLKSNKMQIRNRKTANPDS